MDLSPLRKRVAYGSLSLKIPYYEKDLKKGTSKIVQTVPQRTKRQVTQHTKTSKHT
ncbi:predicted protein [Histoplasma mississippiense (nom. inval.)]|uniref:predicted protein n=1 Tax=Ajellomyces capsulatus (strain NAm1 / WU24) TaxID=2059318 RepID=UPI000157C300|nr:predicted protein [Histoplasma mississippiense (nom. inval.)]EDN07243.1 predicted protein [Histoplasma mississippiense (nom. inval.)]